MITKEINLMEMVPSIRLPKELESARRILDRLDVKKAKRYAVIAAGALCGIKLLSSVSRDLTYQSAVSREIKKQLAPVLAELEELKSQNQTLIERNLALEAKLQAVSPSDDGLCGQKACKA